MKKVIYIATGIVLLMAASITFIVIFLNNQYNQVNDKDSDDDKDSADDSGSGGSGSGGG